MSKTERFRQYWIKNVPNWIQIVFYNDMEFSVLQTNVWAAILGIFGGIVSAGYKLLLEFLLGVVWNDIPNALTKAGMFGSKFRTYNYNWIAALVLGTCTGLLIKMWKYTPFKGTSTIPEVISNVHGPGVIPLKHVVPMLVVSLISIISGGSAGPEAAVIIIVGAMGSWIGICWLQPRRTRRIMTLCGMSAGLAAFFGLPLGAALFCLELPHVASLQYFEALSPAILCTILSVIVSKIITQTPLGGMYMFPNLGEINYMALVKGAAMGLGGAVIAAIFMVTLKYTKMAVKKLKIGPIVLGIMGGALFGIMGTLCPSTLFWSENELQAVFLRGNSSLPYAIHPGIWPMKVPLGWEDFALIGFTKLVTIIITIAAGFPGGIIFPLFFAAACIGYSMALLLHLPPTVCMLSMMAALQSSVTRTPWSTALILLQIQSGIFSTPDVPVVHYIAAFAVMVEVIWISTSITTWFALYPQQRNRSDLIFLEEHEDKVTQEEYKSLLSGQFDDTRPLDTTGEPGDIVVVGSRTSMNVNTLNDGDTISETP